MKNFAHLLIFLLFIHSHSLGQPINIVTLNWHPYVGEKLPDNGFHAEIVRSAFKQINKDINLKFLPWKRAYKLALDGGIFLMSASNTAERREIFNYSMPYDNAATHLIKLKNNKLDFNGELQSLKPYNIGILRGHYIASVLRNAGINKIKEVNNDKQNMTKLYYQRVDFIVMSELTALETVKQTPNITQDKIHILEPALKDNPIHLIGSKKMSNSIEVINGFNKGLREIKRNGTYAATVKKFGL